LVEGFSWFVVLLVAGVVIVSVFIRDDVPRDASGTLVLNDFSAFYTGARLWLEGHEADLYDRTVQLEFQKRLADREIRSVNAFLNPPIALTLYVPFSLAGYVPGLAAWWAVGLAAWILGLEALRRSGGASATLPQWLTVAVRFFPFLLTFLCGQATGLVFLVWAGTVALLRNDRDLLAGLCLSLLVFKPQLAVPLAIPLLAAWRFRALAGGAIGLAVAAVISWLIFPAETLAWLQQSDQLASFLRSEGYKSWQLHSVFGFFVLLLDPLSRRLSDVATTLATLALCGYVACLWIGKPWRPRSREWDHRLAASLAIGLLLGVHLFLYDLALLLLPLVLVSPRDRPAAGETYLDGGPVLGWTALLYMAAFLSSFLVLAQQDVFRHWGLPAIGVQLSVLAVLGWSWTVYRPGRGLVPSA
jgi:hypothetical protein